MATLTGRTPKDTYKDLLQLPNGNAGLDALPRNVADGDGKPCPLVLSSDRGGFNSTLRLPTATVTSALTLNASYSTVRIDTTAGAVPVALPPAADFVNCLFSIKWVAGANPPSVIGTIDGDAGGYVFSMLKESITVHSNGTDWDII